MAQAGFAGKGYAGVSRPAASAGAGPAARGAWVSPPAGPAVSAGLPGSGSAPRGAAVTLGASPFRSDGAAPAPLPGHLVITEAALSKPRVPPER